MLVKLVWSKSEFATSLNNYFLESGNSGQFWGLCKAHHVIVICWETCEHKSYRWFMYLAAVKIGGI
jgi:hypothetical protein